MNITNTVEPVAPTGARLRTTSTRTRPTHRVLMGCGVAAGPLFLAVGVVQGLTREGFDFTRNAISQLSLGDWGWIQVINFVVAGTLIIVGATGLRRALRDGPGATWAPRLVTVFGASFLVSAVFAADPGAGFPVGTPDGPTTALSTNGAVHMVGGMIGYLALCAAFIALARPFSAQGRRGWALASRIVPVVVIAGFVGSSASVLLFFTGAAVGLVWLSATIARLATTTSN
ncbi:Protein of unknown function [Micromonospora citrea]|uniref:DUF998 domain-containing protein n=1 Tax=Micromonospora citrea TaxID=47855 RepID=A0A1C6TUP7_9ACTN|nr:DUF998 domain-containing protein [Micromonospora citrea]SCL45331.1 Protein of unknown function [Micromonospora citrea]